MDSSTPEIQLGRLRTSRGLGPSVAPMAVELHQINQVGAPVADAHTPGLNVSSPLNDDRECRHPRLGKWHRPGRLTPQISPRRELSL
jgi:hypothetical protein